MHTLNSLDVSGKIVSDISKNNNSVVFMLEQNLAPNVNLKIQVKCFKEAAHRFNETGLNKNDFIALINGVLYQKDNINIVKIENISQIINMSLRKESLDLGTVNI